jgi:hypothetical protein
MAGRALAAQDPGGSIVLAPGTEAKPGPFWIGIETRPVPEAMRAELKLPEGQGLVVEQVVPGSPAAAAKLQRHDVLLKAGDKPLAEVRDLVGAIDAAQGKELSLEILRSGKTTTVNVTPAKRPAEMAESLPEGAWPGGPEWDHLRKWLEQVQPGRGGQPPMRFWHLQPGAVLPPGAAAPPIPGNLAISVTRQGQQPAKIHVARGTEQWDVTEKELDKLPADIRPHVERMLNPGARWMEVPFGFSPSPAWQPRVRVEAKPVPAPSPGVEQRLDEMTRQLEQLRKSVDDLRQRLPPPATPKK